MSYTVETTRDRISAKDEQGVEICGAYQPAGHNYWQLYLSRSVTDLTGLRTPPHREHFWDDKGGADARAWVEVIAALYSLAAQAKVAV